MRIAMVGTRGVPAHYGGFETAIEEVGSRLATRGHEIVVFCRRPEGQPALKTYKGMELVHLPALKRRSLETLSHTAQSVLSRRMKGVDVAFVFNAANAPLLPVIRARRVPVATHVDGLEWKRTKWGPVGRRYYRVAESLAVRYSNALIADAHGIADYYQAEFGAPTRLISYGAPILLNAGFDRLAELDLEPKRYHLVVARTEPENHVLEIVKGYVSSAARSPLVVVGSAPYADNYLAEIRDATDDRVRMIGGVWDQDQLDQLYAHSLTYLHGHSVGGTNPSLLRAAGAGAFVIAYDVSFNREVVGEHAQYFKYPADVAYEVVEAELRSRQCGERGEDLRRDIVRYSWEKVSDQYEQLARDLLGCAGWCNRVANGRRRPVEGAMRFSVDEREA